MRIGTWIGKFFVSTTIVLESSPIWILVACYAAVFYIFAFTSDMDLWFLALYLMVFGVFPFATTMLTIALAFIVFCMYANINWGWFN
jgi:hypothetical protein